jgi:hypothetical protein
VLDCFWTVSEVAFSETGLPVLSVLGSRLSLVPLLCLSEGSDEDSIQSRDIKKAGQHLLVRPFELNHREGCSFVESQQGVY